MASIRRVNVYQEVLNQIDEYITANGLRPGDRIPSDRELAQTLGVSRVVIRQALKVLAGFGRVEARQGAGTFVCDTSYGAAVADLLRGFRLDQEFLHQIVPVRIAVDTEVFSQAFERRTPENIATVRRALDASLGRLEGDTEETDLTFTFEAALGAICGNDLLQRLQKVVHRIWVQAWANIGMAPADKHLFQQEHEAIFDAFCRGDREEAFALFQAHIDSERVFARLEASEKPGLRKSKRTSGKDLALQPSPK